jgi:hypothetical protein
MVELMKTLRIDGLELLRSDYTKYDLLEALNLTIESTHLGYKCIEGQLQDEVKRNIQYVKVGILVHYDGNRLLIDSEL